MSDRKGSYSKIKDGNERVKWEGLGRILRICIKIYEEEQVVFHTCDFGNAKKGNYFGREQVERAEEEIRVK